MLKIPWSQTLSPSFYAVGHSAIGSCKAWSVIFNKPLLSLKHSLQAQAIYVSLPHKVKSQRPKKWHHERDAIVFQQFQSRVKVAVGLLSYSVEFCGQYGWTSLGNHGTLHPLQGWFQVSCTGHRVPCRTLLPEPFLNGFYHLTSQLHHLQRPVQNENMEPPFKPQREKH